jgi:hypothetical protein
MNVDLTHIIYLYVREISLKFAVAYRILGKKRVVPLIIHILISNSITVS